MPTSAGHVRTTILIPESGPSGQSKSLDPILIPESGPSGQSKSLDPIVHSRAWKAQVPYLARRSRVITIDPRGNGRSDRPQSPAAYADTEFVADTVAVMDACGVDRAVIVGISTQLTQFLPGWLRPRRIGLLG